MRIVKCFVYSTLHDGKIWTPNKPLESWTDAQDRWICRRIDCMTRKLKQFNTQVLEKLAVTRWWKIYERYHETFYILKDKTYLLKKHTGGETFEGKQAVGRQCYSWPDIKRWVNSQLIYNTMADNKDFEIHRSQTALWRWHQSSQWYWHYTGCPL